MLRWIDYASTTLSRYWSSEVNFLLTKALDLLGQHRLSWSHNRGDIYKYTTTRIRMYACVDAHGHIVCYMLKGLSVSYVFLMTTTQWNIQVICVAAGENYTILLVI